MFSMAPFAKPSFSTASLPPNWRQTANTLFQAVIQPLTATSSSNPSRHYDDKLSEMEEGRLTPRPTDTSQKNTFNSHATPPPITLNKVTMADIVIDVAPEPPPERAQISEPPVYGDNNV